MFPPPSFFSLFLSLFFPLSFPLFQADRARAQLLADQAATKRAKVKAARERREGNIEKKKEEIKAQFEAEDSAKKESGAAASSGAAKKPKKKKGDKAEKDSA
jgi:hypothetical protein